MFIPTYLRVLMKEMDRNWIIENKSHRFNLHWLILLGEKNFEQIYEIQIIKKYKG